MSRIIVFIASISIAVLAVSSTCLASPADAGAAAQSMFLASSDDGFVARWPSSEAPSRIVGGGLLSV